MCAHGFWLIYDLRCLGTPQLEFVSTFATWVNEQPERQDTWKKECCGLKIVVPEGVQMQLSKMLLTFIFFWSPPIVRTYLVTDPQNEVGDHTLHYEPDGIAFLEGSSAGASRGL